MHLQKGDLQAACDPAKIRECVHVCAQTPIWSPGGDSEGQASWNMDMKLSKAVPAKAGELLREKSPRQSHDSNKNTILLQV